MGEIKNRMMPYENIAMAGGEMPIGLEYPDQILFLGLRMLYESYRRKMIDRETAAREKFELIREYDANVIGEQAVKDCILLMKRTELVRAEYRKNRTLENADKLAKSIDGGNCHGKK